EDDECEIELDPSDVYSPSLDPNAKFENEMDDNNLDIVVVNYDHPKDIVAKIQAGQYNQIPIEEQIRFVGDYQIVSEKIYYFGTKMNLFKQFKELFPFIPISKTQFYR
ncbi:MAG: hypothetical protein EZS28_028469, partial [Streblomastix strix]